MKNLPGRSNVYRELGIRKDLVEKFKEQLKKLVLDIKGTRVHVENMAELSERITVKGAEKVTEWHKILETAEVVLEGILKEVEEYLLGRR